MEPANNENYQNEKEKFTNKDELPKTEAFQHEFTREFLVSTEEVEEGYYLFESKTGGYQMLFPINATVDGGRFYSKSEDNTLETVHISGSYGNENINYYIKIRYEKGNYTNKIDSNLNLISKLYDYEGDFEEYTVAGKSIYFGEYVLDTDDIVEGFFLCFLAYIKSQNTDQGISISYGTSCSVESLDACDIDKDNELSRAKKIFESIKFTD